MTQFIKKNITSIFIFFYLLVALVNDGFMGTDEYWNAMVKYLPAQTAKLSELVDKEDVKSPLQVLPMHLGSQLALNINFQHPYDQYRFTIIFIASISILLYIITFNLLAKYKNWKEDKEFYVFVGLMTFYFASSFALTRPMFESLAAPWILLSCGFFLKYQETKKSSALILSTLAVSMGFVMRQQAGIGALTLPLILLFNKDYKGLVITAIVGLLAFVMAGVPDIFLRGSFHHSLIAVTTYNVEHGHEYGNGSILFYPLMLVFMSFLPFYFTKKYEKNFVVDSLKKQKFSLIFIFLFVALHSYFPQKFERFLISIIPLVLVVMTPFVNFFLTHFREYKVRLSIALVLNFLILIAASFQPSQNNIIKMALFIDNHPEVIKVLNFDKTLEWIPEKFIAKNKHYQIIDINEASIKDFSPQSCENIIVINEFLYEQNKEQLSQFKVKDKFGVNFIESIAYKLNRKNNIRRSPLVILGC
jgi:hypothetical protein